MRSTWLEILQKKNKANLFFDTVYSILPFRLFKSKSTEKSTENVFLFFISSLKNILKISVLL